MAPVSIAVVRVRWESEKPGPQHCAITYPQCCGGRRDRSRTAGGPTTTRPGPPAPSDMLPVGCPRAAQVGACFKSTTAWGNAYPCPERQHHVCCPPGMATLARATGSTRGLCDINQPIDRGTTRIRFCGARKGAGVRGNLTVVGPRMTGAQSAPCLALNGPCGAPRGGLVQQAGPEGCTSRSRAGMAGRRVRRSRWLQRRHGGAPG